MLEYKLPRYLPSAEELPDSDETPVDNELQELLPGLLKAILLMLWSERMDWFFGIDMGAHHVVEYLPLHPVPQDLEFVTRTIIGMSAGRSKEDAVLRRN